MDWLLVIITYCNGQFVVAESRNKCATELLVCVAKAKEGHQKQVAFDCITEATLRGSK